MKIDGARLVVRALEEEGVRFTFGIPGTHNLELYDALAGSTVEPILVTDEQSASFMADAVSRTSGTVGVVNVVPGAGVTHCLSGVAEAYMDNIPLVVLCCGIRNDTGAAYQLHDIDQLALLARVTKETFKVERPEEIYQAVRRAFALARSGTPGPVAVEIPANYYMLRQEVGEAHYKAAEAASPPPDHEALRNASEMLSSARHPALYVGNGARNAADLVLRAAEKLQAPVATTIQGKGVFPERHPLWLWNGFGASAPKFVRTVMDRCDCLLALGCRFSEVATASYGLRPPQALIHVDINPQVFHRNYPALLAIESDAARFLEELLPLLRDGGKRAGLKGEIRAGHERVQAERGELAVGERVTPEVFFSALMDAAERNCIYTTDSGNGTFLAMEHLRLDRPGCFIGPIDYSCMGYSVPAAIGAKLANPERDVVALAGDGALLMTGLELLTASTRGVAPVVCVLRDGELGQISQFQRTAFNRDTCSILADYRVAAFAAVTNCRYMLLAENARAASVIEEALGTARGGTPVMVEVAIDYSRQTYFTRGVVRTNLLRLPWGERLRMVRRALGRRLVSR